MSFLATFLHHPRKLWLRRALFQVHLWSGVLLSLYVVVIALTGSILVFRTELTRTQLPYTLHPHDPTHTASIDTALQRFRTAYPNATLTNIQLPSPQLPAYILYATDHQQPLRVLADPVTAVVSTQPHTWLDTIYDLHVYLLLGHAYGMQVNAIGAAILLLISFSGLYLWWPGIKLWTRGLRIDLRRNLRRINYDTHNAIGFWTLLLVTWWAISGVYFGAYRQVTAVVSTVSPLRGMLSPAPPRQTPSTQRASLDQILTAVHQASPNGHLFSLSDPMLTTPTVYALVDLRAPGDFSHRDILTLSTADARVLILWHYGQNHTAGDWFLWAMHPLHFGTLWGLPIKLFYAAAGFALALLPITGLLMYWNRYLRHQLQSPTL